MRAITIPEHGDTSVLTLVSDFPKPTLAPGEVLLKVSATGLNRIDLIVRGGYPGIPIELPHIPGGDIAGTVEELGEDVEDVAVGTRAIVHPLVVCGACDQCHDGRENLCLNWKYFGMHLKGGSAEYVAMPSANIVPLPDSVSFEDAVALPVAGLTAMHALKTVGQLSEGETFLIWGGSGGLGTLAIQIAKRLGARVIATANSDEKLKVMRELGADLVLNRLTDDIAAEVRKFAPTGVDAILDYVGPQTFPISFDLLRKGGRMLLCGIITGRETTLSIHQTYLRHLSIHGLYLGTKQELSELVEWVADGAVKPVVGAVLPLEETAEAHRRMEAGEFIGKIALTL
jgi:alcohol dehydrogenase